MIYPFCDENEHRRFVQVERLSWLTAASLVALTPRRFGLAVLHLMDGAYDCLAFMDESPTAAIVLNRSGNSATVGQVHIPHIWSLAAAGTYGPLHLAVRLLDHLEPMESYIRSPEDRQVPSDSAQMAMRLASWLDAERQAHRHVLWGLDYDYWQCSDVPRDELLREFNIPGDWRRQPQMWPWVPIEGNFFALVEAGRPVALVNMTTGEAVDPTGRPWSDWPPFGTLLTTMATGQWQRALDLVR